MDNTHMTNEEIAEQYEAQSGHPYLPVRYREETEPYPTWMLALFGLMGAFLVVFILGVS